MTHNPLIRPMISACMILLALMSGATTSRSQITTSSAMAHPAPGIFYLKIGGLAGPAKGYFNKNIECHGFNTTVYIPDRLKAGTYYIQFVDAGGRAYPVPTGSSVVITSQPKDAGTAMPSGKQTHEPIRIVKEIDKSTQLNFIIAPEDVDGDGMLNVTMTVKPEGGTLLLPPPNTSQQVRGTTQLQGGMQPNASTPPAPIH
jgi:hypothetical protein